MMGDLRSEALGEFRDDCSCVSARSSAHNQSPNVAWLTVQRDNADDEPDGQDHDHERVDLEARRFVGVKSYCNPYQPKRSPLSFSRGNRACCCCCQKSSRMLPNVCSQKKNVLNIVLLLPPAPAARVLVGRALAALSARSAAAFLRIAVAGPPGALGDAARAVVEPVDGETGEVGRGAD
jgi:hypothetical protein